MPRHTWLIALALLAAAPAFAQVGEEPVEPYEMSNANAGAAPFSDPRLLAAFHGREGIARIVQGLLDRSFTDPRTVEIFQSHDRVRLTRTLNEQLCYILGGGCDYTGRDMKSSHKDLGLQTRDMNILVEHLREAMEEERVPNAAQNRLLSRLAPMKRDVVVR